MKVDDEDDVDNRDDDQHDDTTHQEESDEAVEARARKNGWIRPDEWDASRAAREGKAKPRQFMSAREFLARVDNELPLLRDRNRRLDGMVTKLEGRLSEMGTQVKETRDLLVKQHEMSKKANEAAYERGIKAARAEMRRAVENGDTDAFDKAEAEVQKLEKARDAIDEDTGDEDDTRRGEDDDTRQRRPANGDAQPPRKRVDPVTQAWLDDPANKWFHADPALNGHMIKMNGVVRQEHPDWSIAEQLAEAEARVRKKFPEEFGENPNRRGTGAVSRGSEEDRGKKGKNSFDSIPKEDQATFYRLEKQFKAAGKVITKAEYAEEYFNQ